MIGDDYPFNFFQPECDGKVLFHPHWHERHMEIIIVAEGQAEFHIGGRSYDAVPGDIYFMPEGQIHGGYLKETIPSYYTILFDRSALAGTNSNIRSYEPLLGGELSLPDRIRPDDPHYHALAETIRTTIGEFIHRKQGYEMAVRSLLHVLLIRLARAYAAEHGILHDSQADRRHAEQLKHVMMHVDNHYMDKISVQEASKLANMSVHHFCRTFKKTAGRTFTEFLNSYRINKAAELIVHTDLPITRIAEQVGFGTINYFDEMFKKFTGQSPTQFRKNKGKRQ